MANECMRIIVNAQHFCCCYHFQSIYKLHTFYAEFDAGLLFMHKWCFFRSLLLLLNFIFEKIIENVRPKRSCTYARP